MVIDESGNLYLTGSSDYAGTSFDYTRIKYNSSSAELWVAQYDGLANGPDMATAIAIDDDNKVYVSGERTIWGCFFSRVFKKKINKFLA